ncbi:MAG TPA: choline/ethanolamine kinase family protein [Acetobacteraceae bacterium]|nr:choline/ethanolamine kinase family protein [Acetobacteraceae bacterium]
MPNAGHGGSGPCIDETPALRILGGNEADHERVRSACARLGPALAAHGAREVSCTRLGGLTNANYRLDAGNARFVLRIPGAGTSQYIDRAAEAHAARATAEIGVNAEVLFFDETDGIQLCTFIEGGITMSPERFQDRGRIERAARALHTVHTRSRPFKTDFDLFAVMDEYRALLRDKNTPLPDGTEVVARQAEVMREVLARRPVPAVASHCDPLAENFIDVGDRMFIVDWEYSGNNDPMWDLGDLSVEAGFGPEAEAWLMHAYFEGEAPAPERSRMTLHKALCDLLWTFWGVLQHANNNPAEDFWTYSETRLRRCATLMNTAEFAQAIATLRAP